MSVVRLSTIQYLRAILSHCGSAITVMLVLAVAVGATVSQARPVSAATSPTGLPLPRALALSLHVFPRGAVAHGAPASREQAATATGLHTLSLAQLGRVEGYAQSAQWNLPAQQRHVYPASLQYEASIFATPGDATDATTDAQASLWEAGKPLRV